MDDSRWLAALVAEGDAIAAIARDAYGAPVAACPGWDVARLISHVGRVHRWVAGFLRGDDAPVPRPDGEDLSKWYRESRDLLLRQLDGMDLDGEVDTFLGRRTVRFWLRRQAHETAMHRWDAQDAVRPGAAAPIDADFAGDGIDEWLHVFVPRFLARVDVPGELVGTATQFVCTDLDGPPWTLRLTHPEPTIDYGAAAADTVLSGNAADLLLTVWHRRPATRAESTDAELARRVLDLIHVT
ncbi:maleylpyruvate isomerase family mycothiol-dependent enzyme [Nocardia aobensis]|uniref:maleylpyruvate isomerase family mycothiol-dependent enzyme n=1 Tax=Nocardia aobensis TaxID=257277 RepID=UPI0003029EB5|nr:maleylpyruvate isomerase family mycothiol-dependent enzyme [Nocardia aobensis]